MKTANQRKLTSENLFSIYYHSLFEFPLTTLELVKWQPGRKFRNKSLNIPYEYNDGYFFSRSKKGFLVKRMFKRRESFRKVEIARKTARILKRIPYIKCIAITGSLAMFNAVEDSDIDLMVITSKGGLWFTRLLSLLLLSISGVKIRRYGRNDEKDRVCMNIWLDESSFAWPKNDRNFYTAHEIAQIIPVINKDHNFQKFMYKNSWVKDFWPNATKITEVKVEKPTHNFFQTNLGRLIEKVSFRLQRFYMQKKITREVVRKNRAIFHPIDRYKIIQRDLASVLK